MARECKQVRRSSSRRRIKGYTAVAIASATLLAAIDHAYSTFRSSRLIPDAADRLSEVTGRHMAQPAHFRLEVGGEEFATDPHDAAIGAAVLIAATNAENEAFLSLSRSSDDFMQAAPAKGGWDLEFRAYGLDRPSSLPIVFECQKPVGARLVTTALQLYRADDTAWMALCAWTPAKL